MSVHAPKTIEKSTILMPELANGTPRRTNCPLIVQRIGDVCSIGSQARQESNERRHADQDWKEDQFHHVEAPRIHHDAGLRLDKRSGNNDQPVSH